jgi:hypothetical protein
VQHVGSDGSVEDCVEAVKIADQLLEKKKL